MESVLYDLYIAEGEMSVEQDIFSFDSLRRKAIFNSVLEKHKITQEELDSSLNWYAARLDSYFKIIEKIENKYAQNIQLLNEEEQKLEVSIEDMEGVVLLPYKKDSVPFISLLTLPGKVLTFESDTLIDRYGGTYDVQFQVLGLDKQLSPEITLFVQCSDTTYITKTNIEQNGFFAASLSIPQIKKFEQVYGNIYFPELSAQSNIMLHHFHLVLYMGERKIPHLQKREDTELEMPESLIKAKVRN